jgi:hypothetical protein
LRVEAPAIDEREFRPAWRVKTKLMLLREFGRIARRQLEAAVSFKSWCEAIGRQRRSPDSWRSLAAPVRRLQAMLSLSRPLVITS